MATGERWVGADRVAAHLGVTKDSVYRWVEAGGLPAHRVGRLLRFRISEIDRWVLARGTAASRDADLACAARGKLPARRPSQ